MTESTKPGFAGGGYAKARVLGESNSPPTLHARGSPPLAENFGGQAYFKTVSLSSVALAKDES